MKSQNVKLMVSETKIRDFVWASKFYSRVLNQVIWIVLDYPFKLADEEFYWKIKNSLKLCSRGRKEWKIFPSPFMPDGFSVYFTKTGCKQPGHDFSKKNPPKVPQK